MITAPDAKNTLLLSTATFPPVEYFVFLAEAENVWIEGDENFNKQTYRNRYIINTANGPLTQVVPVKRNHDGKTKIARVGVDYDLPWPRQFWRAIFAAYNKTPFFLFYQDELEDFFNRSFASLLEMNMVALELVNSLLGINKDIKMSKDFRKSYKEAIDLRYSIHPKKPQIVKLSPWMQAFDERHGFNPRVSILDLLFNMGPESLMYLKQAYPQEPLSLN